MPATSLAICFSPALFAAAVALHGDIVRFDIQWLLAAIHKHHVDDAALCILPLMLAIVFDHRNGRRRLRAEMEAQKLRTFRATMRTVQDIVNNFLNHVLLVQLDLRGYARSEDLRALEELVQTTAQRLKALGDIPAVCERETVTGPTIFYGEPENGGAGERQMSASAYE